MIVDSEILSEFAPRIVNKHFVLLFAFKMSSQNNLGQTTELSEVVNVANFILDTIINIFELLESS